MSKEIADAKKRLFPMGKKVLGVLGRGTDYVSTRPKWHSIVPDIDLLIRTTDEKLQAWQYDYVYLATEDQEIYDAMKKKYGEKLLALDVPRFAHDTDNRRLSQLKFKRENDEYLRGKEYLLTIYLMAQCDGIITSATGGGLAAVRINGGAYEHKYVFDLGIY